MNPAKKDTKARSADQESTIFLSNLKGNKEKRLKKKVGKSGRSEGDWGGKQGWLGDRRC